MKRKSKYDNLHDRYLNASTTKSGTRYERLVACVCKLLNSDSLIIHDIRLTGKSDVKHQIDVIIEKQGEHKRVLIECKDFDISGEKVGLSIVRDFWGVVDDIHPDEAIVITCTSFTSDAKKYAKNKGIKLAILREFTNTDMNNRIKKIIVRTHIWDYSQPEIDLYIPPNDMMGIPKVLRNELQNINVDRNIPIYLNLQSGKQALFDFIEEKMVAYPINNPGRIRLPIELENATMELSDYGEVPILGLIINYDVFLVEEKIEKTSKKVAQIIVEGFDDTDLIVFDDDIERLNIDKDTGEVSLS